MSFPKYPKYKESGVEWLGDVPEHWKALQMKRISTIRYGIGEPPKYHDEGTPLIGATNVHAGRLFAEGLVFVDPNEIPNQRIVWLAAGDIIVVRSGAYTGDSAIIPDGFGSSIAGFDMVLKCHSACPRFIQFALLSNYLQEGQIDLEKMRAAQPHLNAEELCSCVVVLPNADEQTAIVSFLDAETSKIDLLIAEQRRLIELLKEKRQAVISHAVTKGLNPNAPIKPSGIEWLGDVPEHWRVGKLGYACKLRGGFAFAAADFGADGVVVVRMNNLKRGQLDLAEAARIPESCCNDAVALAAGDLVWGMSGSTGETGSLGNYARVRAKDLPCQLNQRVGRFVVDKSLLNLDFFENVIQTAYFYEQVMLLVTGTAQFNVSSEQVQSCLIALPTIDEQCAIWEFVDRETAALDALTAEAERAIDLLQERRTALISAAVTGKIDVREFCNLEAV